MNNAHIGYCDGVIILDQNIVILMYRMNKH